CRSAAPARCPRGSPSVRPSLAACRLPLVTRHHGRNVPVPCSAVPLGDTQPTSLLPASGAAKSVASANQQHTNNHPAERQIQPDPRLHSRTRSQITQITAVNGGGRVCGSASLT